MTKRTLICLSVIALCIASVGTLGAQPQSDEALKFGNNPPRDRSLPTTRAVSPRGGTRNIPVGIIYDDGIVTATPASSSFSYGNQFNSASGMTVKSFSVTMVSAFIMTAAGTDNVFVSIFGPVSGTAAPVLGSPSLPLNNGPGTFNTFTVGPYTGVGSFLAGIWYIAGDTVGLGSGTVGGQGHHGMLINDIAGTGFSTLPGLNALVGASTGNIIPVELTSFSIEN